MAQLKELIVNGASRLLNTLNVDGNATFGETVSTKKITVGANGPTSGDNGVAIQSSEHLLLYSNDNPKKGLWIGAGANLYLSYGRNQGDTSADNLIIRHDATEIARFDKDNNFTVKNNLIVNENITAPKAQFTDTDTDASGTAKKTPALIIGSETGQHLEFDANEIMSKTTDTTTGTLYLNYDGGSVYIGGPLQVKSNIQRYYSATNDEPMITALSNNQDIYLFEVGHGNALASVGNANHYKLLYKGTNSSPNNYLQLIAYKNTSSGDQIAIQVDEDANVNIPKWANIGNTDTHPINMDSSGRPKAITFTASRAIVSNENGGLASENLSVSNPESSNGTNNLVFVSSLTQDPKGKITIIRNPVREATDQRSGIVSIDDQNFKGQKTIIHTKDQGGEFRTIYSTTVDMWFGVDSANENHGIRDVKADRWMIASDITAKNGKTVINRANFTDVIAGTTIGTDTKIEGTFNATGDTTISGTLGVTKATTLSNTLAVTGATILSSTLNVTGITTLNDNLDIITGNTDKFINFYYPTADKPHAASWRLGYLGTGQANANYFVLQSGNSDSKKSTGWNSALQIGMNDHDITIDGNTLIFDNTIQKIQGKDSAGTIYSLIAYTGTNLWVGADKSNLAHHTGATYISTGWAGDDPEVDADAKASTNTTIYISVPKKQISTNNIVTWSHTSYPVLHTGNGWSLTGGIIINNAGTLLTAYNDFNKIIAVGNYYCTHSAAVSGGKMANSPFSSMAAFTLKVEHSTGNSNTYLRQIVRLYHSGDEAERTSANKGETWSDWRIKLNNSNYTTYTVKQDGDGAYGTWNIGIKGNAANASKVTQTNSNADHYRAILLSGEAWESTTIGAKTDEDDTEVNNVYYDAPNNSRGMGLGFNPDSNTLWVGGPINLKKDDTDYQLKIIPGALTKNITIGTTTTDFTLSTGLEILSGNLTLSSGIINQSSDRTVKHDIQSIPKAYEQFYNNLQPKQFKYNQDIMERNRFGFIAQEVEEAYEKAELNYQDDAIIAKRDNDEQGNWDLNMIDIIPLNTWQIQQMKQEIELLKTEIAELRKLVIK